MYSRWVGGNAMFKNIGTVAYTEHLNDKVLTIELSAQQDESETKQFKNCFKNVLFQFHIVVQTVPVSEVRAISDKCALEFRIYMTPLTN